MALAIFHDKVAEKIKKKSEKYVKTIK
ncbi:hypothetical protein SHD_1814 [Shewanella decolorationis S12]|uniref:Uncharacterized protein n=1 Tax=Shewanella decolorationis S12 TaxID=1353536 RepID=A0ABN0PN82_9GAMM|nr:hypothetical protein SHD_1814 [Shewanella decolorationis S12]